MADGRRIIEKLKEELDEREKNVAKGNELLQQLKAWKVVEAELETKEKQLDDEFRKLGTSVYFKWKVL